MRLTISTIGSCIFELQIGPIMVNFHRQIWTVTIAFVRDAGKDSEQVVCKRGWREGWITNDIFGERTKRRSAADERIILRV